MCVLLARNSFEENFIHPRTCHVGQSVIMPTTEWRSHFKWNFRWKFSFWFAILSVSSKCRAAHAVPSMRMGIHMKYSMGVSIMGKWLTTNCRQSNPIVFVSYRFACPCAYVCMCVCVHSGFRLAHRDQLANDYSHWMHCHYVTSLVGRISHWNQISK